MSRREVVYLLLAVLGLVGPTVFNAQYVAQGGSLFDIVAFFLLGFVNPASSSVTVDCSLPSLRLCCGRFPSRGDSACGRVGCTQSSV